MKTLSVALALILLAVTAAPAQAVTTNDHEKRIMDWVNEARVDRGLVPLRLDSRLWDVAGDRAATMAATNILSHTVAGALGSQLTSRGISWYRNSEVIAYNGEDRGTAATERLFEQWASSPAHWALLMSDQFNYIGVGMAYRSSNDRTFGSVVMIEGPDRTGAYASMNGVTLTGGNDIRWTWTGYDPQLQTRTSGLRDFTVQQRTDSGSWVTVASATTATARSAMDRPRGHWYGVRVQARDQAGNFGPWSAEQRIWVP